MKTNWQTKSIGEILKFEYGKPLPKSDRSENGKYGVYGANGIKAKSNKFYFGKPSIIVGRKGSAGELKLVDEPFWPLDVTYFVTFDEKANDLKFLYHLLLNQNISKLAKGVKPGINRNDVYSINVNVPPLPEQKQIVKILDGVFADVEKAKENAEKNLASAKELFESYLQSVFENPGEDWEEKKLEEICELQYGYTDKAKNNGKFRFIRITDITDGGELQLDNKMYIRSFNDYEKYLLVKDDLLMARTGATFAKVLLHKNVEPSVFASYLIRIRFKIKTENKLYWYFSKSKLYWQQANQLSSGSAQPQFNGNALKKLIFIFPKSLKTQKQIVKRLDELSAQTKKLEAVYQQKIDDLEELKKSVLKKAFEGKL